MNFPFHSQPQQYSSPYQRLPLQKAKEGAVAIIKPIDKDLDISRQEYDPNTIARDVLLALDVHPDRPGLNHHLRPLFLNYRQVTNDSDLSTFRWDLVDSDGFCFSPRPAPPDMPPAFSEQGNYWSQQVRPPFQPGERNSYSRSIDLSGLAIHQVSKVDAAGAVLEGSDTVQLPHAHPSASRPNSLPADSFQVQPASHTLFFSQGSSRSQPPIFSHQTPYFPPHFQSGPSTISHLGPQLAPSTAPHLSSSPFFSLQESNNSVIYAQPPASTASGAAKYLSPVRERYAPSISRTGSQSVPQTTPKYPPYTVQGSVMHEPRATMPFKKSFPPEQNSQPNSFYRSFLPEPTPQSNSSHKSFSLERKEANPNFTPNPTSFAQDAQRQSNIAVVIPPSYKILPSPQAYGDTSSRTHGDHNEFLNAPQPISSSRNLGTPNDSRIAVVIPISTPEKLLAQPSSPFMKDQASATTPKKRGRPFATAEAAAKAAKIADRKAAQLASGQTGRLRRRKVESSSSSDAIAARKHEHTKRKKKGRPFTNRKHVEVSPPEPKYIPYLCEWKNCPAELHNLETLRLHVLNVHGKKSTSERRYCYWRRCDGQEEFVTKKEWKDHIEKAHLIPFAWHMGDGVRGPTLVSCNLSTIQDLSYLKDENGRQVTASVKTQQIEDGRPKDMNRKRFRAKGKGEDLIYVLIKQFDFDRKVDESLRDTADSK